MTPGPPRRRLSARVVLGLPWRASLAPLPSVNPPAQSASFSSEDSLASSITTARWPITRTSHGPSKQRCRRCCADIQGVVRSGPVCGPYPRHVRLYISRAAELLEWSIEPGGNWPSGSALQPAIPADPAASSGDVNERAVARHCRLQQYVEVWMLQGIKATFSDVCGTAGVRRDGRGSGKHG